MSSVYLVRPTSWANSKKEGVECGVIHCCALMSLVWLTSYFYSFPCTHSPAMQRLLAEKMKDYRNHRIISPPALHPCGDSHKRMMVTEHKVAVPLYYPDLEAAAAAPASNNIVTLDRGEYSNNASFENRPTIDVYFTITELVSDTPRQSGEDFAASLMDATLSQRQRADRYLQRAGAAALDASRMVLYLQGGPGFGCAAPVGGLSLASSKASWASAALLGDVTNSEGKTFERIVLMDQRGTGRSSPICKRRLEKMFPDLFSLDGVETEDRPAVKGTLSSSQLHSGRLLQLDRARVFKTVTASSQYLAKFRADSIVRDAEWIKEALITKPFEAEGDDRYSPQPWGAALGQSFGGFCLMTYLSSIAHPPKLCLFTGGIAPMDTPVREVYDRLWLRVKERNLRYYEQYPGDVAVVKRIVQRLLRQEDGGSSPVKIPLEGILMTRRFLQLGLALGGTPGSSFANLHSFINAAFLDGADDDDELSGAFLKRMDYEQAFDDAPLYFLLHESIYADGPSAGATNWAAHASYERAVAADPAFDYRATSDIGGEGASSALPTLFFGEMVFPWMADGDFAGVSGRGMRALSAALAHKKDWAPLYDGANMRAALLGGGGAGPPRARAASATYYDDMYVDFHCAMKLVDHGGPLEGTKVWVTNEHQHSGLRDDGAAIVCRLVSMAKGTVHVPS